MARHVPRPTPAELLTTHFYAWELRGRGWQLYDAPVLIEPPFRPFHRSGILQEGQQTHDDGRVETFGSGVISFLKGLVGQDERSPACAAHEREEPMALYDETVGDVRVTLAVVLPDDAEVSREAAEQLLLSLSTCSAPVSFEVVGTAESITVQVSCAEAEAVSVARTIEAYFPEAVVEDRPDQLRGRWERSGPSTGLIVDFGLSNEFMRPIRTPRNFDVDPLIPVVSTLSDLRAVEIAVLQVLFQSCRQSWAPSVLQAVSDGTGHSFFADAPEMVPLAKEKTARPLCAVRIRAAAKGRSADREESIVRGLVHALEQVAEPSSNEFIPLTNDGYDDAEHEADLLDRVSRRTGMLLNTAELVSLVHLPSASVRSGKLERERRRTKAAPATVIGHELVLGENRHAGSTLTVTLSEEQRSRHVHVIGASGTGKSTLLLNMIVQDIRNGRGIGVLDPHGDLIDAVLGHIPAERHDDVVLFDPSDDEYPVGFNILSAHSELEKTLLASDLAAIFRRFSTSFGDQMQAVLSNAILAILENERGGTLLDLRRLLTEKGFRADYLTTVTDPEVVYYFEREFPLLRGAPHASILTRLNTFLRPKPVRYMVAQRQGLDFAGIMDRGKIFLAKLSNGLIGEENAHLLGALLVTKFHQLAMGRQDRAQQDRRPFTLYIDEFQNFVTPSMALVLSAARKYRLGLVLAHQELGQLLDQDARVASAVLTNPCTRICFRVGDADAKKLADGFSAFDASALQSLGVGEAICRVERAEHDFTLKTPSSPSVTETVAKKRCHAIVGRARANHAKPRAEIEALLVVAREEVTAKEEGADPTAREDVTTLVSASTPPEVTLKGEPRDTEVFPPRTGRKPRAAPPMPPPTLGRGGREHKYLQHLVKRLAEDRGYRATIEQPVLAGTGNVDVALEKGDSRIACEISVSGEVEHEINNIQKCLAGGYGTVLCLSSDARVLRRLQGLVASSLEPSTQERIRFLRPEELVTFLDAIAVDEPGNETTVRGYRIKRAFTAISPAEAESKKQALVRLLHNRTR